MKIKQVGGSATLSAEAAEKLEHLLTCRFEQAKKARQTAGLGSTSYKTRRTLPISVWDLSSSFIKSAGAGSTA
jgi:hypothetical protein